jgi:hypothetical protein
LRDAFDECQAEADACVVNAYAFGAALKPLGVATSRGVSEPRPVPTPRLSAPPFARELGDALIEGVGKRASQASLALTRRFSLGSRLRLSLLIAVCPVRKIDQMRTTRTRATAAISAM